MSDELATVKSYIEGWQRHDAAAVAASFAPGGRYVNPALPDGLSGEAIAAMVADNFTAFPDLRFEQRTLTRGADGRVVFEWRMLGTNDGPPAPGVPATGRAVDLVGCNVFDVTADGIERCEAYFDQLTLMHQLGLAGP